MKKLFSEENKVPRTVFEARRWQGPPHINKVNQACVVKKSLNGDLSILNRNSAPLNILYQKPLYLSLSVHCIQITSNKM